MNIVKQSTGNVVLTDTAGNILKAFVSVNALDVVSSNEIVIKYGYNQWTSIFADQIDNTQVEPASAIPFNGDAYQLATLLSSDFFFEVGGSSPVVPSDGYSIIVKSANQDVNNTTLTNDSDLQFNVVAGGNYLIEMTLATSSDSSLNDYKFAFGVTSGTINGVGNIVCRNASNSATVTAIIATSTNVTNSVVIGQNTGSIPNVSGIVTATVNFGFYASADAVLNFKFALNSGSTTARTWKGSILKYKRLD
jgi:hypothetical protein